jgi:hypothetical protein
LFGLAHVDTPKVFCLIITSINIFFIQISKQQGDLDMSGNLTTTLIIEDSITYPYGTTEQFPQMQDSDLNDLPDSAHGYMECSNKGTCDRTAGECVCYDGYEGAACQRASCPNSCSGNGVCKSKRQMALADEGNTYILWDKDLTMGCFCDPGFTGPDCSLRVCKFGVDPLYLDDSATVKYPIYDFATLTTSSTIDFNDGTPQAGVGKWAIRFYDKFGEDWVTQPITAGATCAEVIAALEALPNNIIPSGVTDCTRTSKSDQPEDNWKGIDAQHSSGPHTYFIYYNLSIWEVVTPEQGGDPSFLNAITVFKGSYPVRANTTISGYIYRIKFYGNPGAIAEPEIELHIDGKRPSLASSGKVITTVWTDGQQGEDYDYFADHCDNVAVSIGTNGYVYFLNDLTVAEKGLLKACLGGSDFDSNNNIDVYNWDTGDGMYPHFIKLVRSVSAYQDGGYYVALWFDSSVSLDNSGDPTSGTFKLINPFQPPDFLSTDQYEIYTTKGVLALASNMSETVVSFSSKYFYMVNSSFDTAAENYGYDGDISCEITPSNVGKMQFISHCLNKGDMFTFLNFDTPTYNPPHLNIYTAARLYTEDFQWSVKDRFGGSDSNDMHYMTHVVKTDISSNWGAALSEGASSSPFRIYKFFPATESTYNYVNQCSNRGLCSQDTGMCSCFSGYTSDDCSVQNSIAI